jgi:SAM-dependent methyltransferase
MFATEALEILLTQYQFQTVLDVGSGSGHHAEVFRQNGKQVTTIDINNAYGVQPDILANYVDYSFIEPFDLVWCSHVLEHQLNVNIFLRKLYKDLKPEGIFAITVPPMKAEIVGGHVTIWNAGLLLYNLILAGFDCSQCQVKRYGYNISVVGKKKQADLPALRMDTGDIELLAMFFPLPVYQNFLGDIRELNWKDSASSVSASLSDLSPAELWTKDSLRFD